MVDLHSMHSALHRQQVEDPFARDRKTGELNSAPLTLSHFHHLNRTGENLIQTISAAHLCLPFLQLTVPLVHSVEIESKQGSFLPADACSYLSTFLTLFHVCASADCLENNVIP